MARMSCFRFLSENLELNLPALRLVFSSMGVTSFVGIGPAAAGESVFDPGQARVEFLDRLDHRRDQPA